MAEECFLTVNNLGSANLTFRQGVFVVKLMDLGGPMKQLGVLEKEGGLLGFIHEQENRNVGTNGRTLPGGRAGGSYVNLYQLVTDILKERASKESNFNARIINYARRGEYKLQIDVASNPN